MALRTHELHPALSHYPIALLPVAVGCDVCGVLLDNDNLLTVGRLVMPMSAVATIVTSAAGVVAQEEVHFDDQALSMLNTHRNLNIAAMGVTSAMAIYRMARHKPGLGYLAIGATTIGMVIYSGYLGSKMVYHKGVGVEEAEGVNLSDSPELLPKNAGKIFSALSRHFVTGLKNTFEGFFSTPDIAPSSEDMQRAIGTESGESAENPAPSGP